MIDWLTWVNTPTKMWLFLTIWKCLQMSISGKAIVICQLSYFCNKNYIRWDQNGPDKPGKHSGILVLSAININGIQLFYFRRVLWADFGTRTKRKIHNRRQWDALFWLNCNNERMGLKQTWKDKSFQAAIAWYSHCKLSLIGLFIPINPIFALWTVENFLVNYKLENILCHTCDKVVVADLEHQFPNVLSTIVSMFATL